MSQQRNVLGGPLQVCCTNPMTGFYRDGNCRTGTQDIGLHTVCTQVTQEFLEFSRAQGNDLITPMPEYDFPGLKPGDCWCVCVTRWKEAADAGFAAPVLLSATHEYSLEFVTMDELQRYALEED